MIQFDDIPAEVIVNYIGCHISFSEIANLALSCKFLKEGISDLVDRFLATTNSFYEFYQKDLRIDILENIPISVFSIYEFEEIMNGISNSDIKVVCLNFDNRYIDTSLESINATFKFFQMFQILAELMEELLENGYSSFIMDEITKSLLRYFRELFKDRNNLREYDENVVDAFLLTREENKSWHKMNINIYFIYENLILIQLLKHSRHCKWFIEDQKDIIINRFPPCQKYTVVFLVKVFQLAKERNRFEALYCLYEIIKYVNIITEEDKRDIKFFHPKKRFIKSCLKTIGDYQHEMNELSSVSKRFKEVVTKEFNRFTEKILENLRF